MCCSSCALTQEEGMDLLDTAGRANLEAVPNHGSSILCVPWEPLWLLLPFKDLCSDMPHLSPKAFNSMKMRPTLSPGLFGERCRQQWVSCAGGNIPPHISWMAGKRAPTSSRETSAFLKQQENILQFQLLANKLCPDPPDQKLLTVKHC